MVKNVKIEDDSHRLLSIEASTLGIKKSDLCTALVYAGLLELPKETVKKYLDIVQNSTQDTEGRDSEE